MKFADKINAVYGIAVSVFTALLGQYWFLFAGLLIFNVTDWLTGWYFAYINKTESSKTGAKGIVKKLGYWVVIAISFYIAKAFTAMGDTIGVDLRFSIGIGWFVLSSYMVNEIRSILENGVKLGWNIPEFLIKGLAVAAERVNNSKN